MIWDNAFALSIVPALLEGLKTTVALTGLGMLIALVLGLVVAVIRRIRVPVVSLVFDFYVSFVRGTPLLVQAYCAYFILPTIGIQLPAFQTGVLVLGVNYSAYIAEVYRAGIQDVPAGQWEAAIALNLPARYTWLRIILPQAIVTTVPVLGNYLIQMFKDSAVLSAITVIELLSTAQQIGSANFRYLEPLTIAGLIFLIISYLASHGIQFLERRAHRFVAR